MEEEAISLTTSRKSGWNNGNGESKYQSDSFDVEIASRLTTTKPSHVPKQDDGLGVYYGGIDERGLLDGEGGTTNKDDDSLVSILQSYLGRLPGKEYLRIL